MRGCHKLARARPAYHSCLCPDAIDPEWAVPVRGTCDARATEQFEGDAACMELGLEATISLIAVRYSYWVTETMVCTHGV